jgi:hypothetical protein
MDVETTYRKGGRRMKPNDVEVLSLCQNIKTGGIYEVTAIAIHSETDERMVVYQPAHPDGADQGLPKGSK